MNFTFIKTSSITILACIFFLLQSSTAHEAFTPDTGEGKLNRYIEFVDTLGHEVIKILQDRGQAMAVRKDRFRAVMQKHFSMEAIGRFAAGQYWRQMSPSQKKAYLQLFEQAVVENYANQFDNYNNEQFVVRSARLTEEKRPAVMVKSMVNRPGQSRPLHVTWKIYNTKRGLQVVDVIIDNVSMGISLRNEYVGAAQNRGVEGLLDYLREKINQSKAS